MVDIVDAPEAVAQLLRGGTRWDTGIIAKPDNIKAIYNWPKLPTPGIFIYQISNTPVQYSYGTGKRRDDDTRVTIDIRALNRQMLKLFEKAVKKVVDQHLKAIEDITFEDVGSVTYENAWNRIYLDPSGTKDLSDRRQDFHRMIIDVILQEVGHVLPTL